jgi:hypothetical protein
MLVEIPLSWYFLTPEHQLYQLDGLANLVGGNQISVVRCNAG